METSKLLNFCTIVECGSLSKAAEKLYVTQPTLSKQISSLETELGYTLFIRNGKKVTLNENGEIVYRFAKSMLKDYDLLKRELFIKNNTPTHEVRFGTTNFIGTYIIPQILGSYKSEYPTTPVNFMVNFLPNIIDLLDRDVINFAILPETSQIVDNKNYICESFLNDEFVLVLPKDHPLNKKEHITALDITEYPFLISQEQSATRQFILSSFSSRHIQLDNLINMNNTNAIKEGITNNLGISILSKISIKNHEQFGLVNTRIIEDLPLTRKLYVVYKTKHIITSEEALFMKEFLRFNKH